MTTQDQRPVFTTRDIADILGVSTNFIRQQVKAGKLHATVNRRFNRRTLLRFSIADVRAYDHDAAERLAAA